MSKNLLLATLGTSPAVVTEAVDLLREEDITISGIYVFVTKDRDVWDSFTLLAEHLPQHDGITWIHPVEVGVYDDIDSTDAAVEFLALASQQLKTLRDAGYRVYVSIAGGRKAMAALLALAVQFYGAERLFHIWVPPWLEAEGEIDKLRDYRNWPEKLNEFLHPRLDMDAEDRPHLITLPVIGLFPFMDDIRTALTGQAEPAREIRRLLRDNGLLAPDGKPTELGQRIAEVLESVEGLPPARQAECQIHIAKHHYSDRLERFARQLCSRFPFITEIRSGEWGSGQAKVKIEAPNVIRVFKPLGTDFPLQLILTTTAKTTGELEAARRNIEEFLFKNGFHS